MGSNEDDLFARAPVALDHGGYGRFRIESTPGGMAADVEQAKRSLRMLPGFVDELVGAYGADARRVYLMGFSQGAMMSPALVLARPEKVAGVMAMSGRLPRQVLEPEPALEALTGKPVLVTHGLYDPTLPVENGRAAREYLAALPVALTYGEYPTGHEVSAESLGDAAGRLTKTFDASRGVSGE